MILSLNPGFSADHEFLKDFLMSRRLSPDFFESQIGTQASVMNAWILWQHQENREPWRKEDLFSALPCVTPSAVEPHLRRLTKDARRGRYLIESSGDNRINAELLPEWLY